MGPSGICLPIQNAIRMNWGSILFKVSAKEHIFDFWNPKKKWILGSMSFTHNNGRSRIIMVVHASFTQFHGVSRTTFFGRQTTSFFGYVTDICKNTWNHVKLREPAWNCVKLRETPWNPRETPWIFVSICHPLHQTHFFLLFMQVPVFYGLHRSVCICAPATRWDGGLANG